MRLKWVIIAAALLGLSAARASEQGDLSHLEDDFRNLPVESRYLTGPLFWLHGDESKEQLETELDKVREGGNGTFTAESRPHKDWLGEGWYRDLQICLDFARRHRMTMWIFDEKWWPSGEVGGKVPQKYGAKELVAEATAVTGPGRIELAGPGERLVAVIAGRKKAGGVDGESLVDLTEQVSAGRLEWDAPEGDWAVMTFSWRYSKNNFGKILVDGASRDAVEWYLNTVYQPHYDRFKDDFGATIQGFFYDEPKTLGDFGTEVIPMLKSRGVDWKKALVAWKFRLSGEDQTAAWYQYQDAKAEAWGKTLYGGISQWCRAHGVISIGHFLEHNREYLRQDLCAGNMFQLMKYTDMGGIDIVFKQLIPGKRPMGIYQTPKLGSSISHVYGKKDDLAMVEIFGARGQDLPYPEMKWATDHVQVRGTNFLIPHSFNPRAPFDRDCPPYFYNGGFEPRFPLYRVFADYTSRLSLMLNSGRHVAPVAFLFMGNSAHAGKAVPPEQMTTALQDALYDCDWMPYEVFERDVMISGKELRLFRERYKVLVVPPAEVIPYETLKKAQEFFEAGGVVLGYGFLPGRSATIGKTGRDIRELTRAIWGEPAGPGLTATKVNPAGGRSYLLSEQPAPEEIIQVLARDAGIHPTLEVVEGKTDNWLHVLHRVKAGSDIFFIANQNLGGGTRRFKLKVSAQGEPEWWDAMRNEITAIEYRRLAKDEVEISLSLEPYESVLLVFNPEKRALPARLSADAQPVREIKVQRDLSVKEPPRPDSQLWRLRAWFKAKGKLTLSPVKANPFNGKFYIPGDLDLSKTRVYVLCEGIEPEAAARITVNNAYAGGFIESPLRLEISKFLGPGANTLRIEPFAPKSVKLAVF